MRYFKVKTGFKEEDFISINENELEAALYAFMTDSKVIFKNGATTGKNIMEIKEDWHKAMGWNTGYRLQPEDFEQINRECKNYRGLLAKAKENVQHLIRSGKTELIGKTDYSQMRALPQGDNGKNGPVHIMQLLPE